MLTGLGINPDRLVGHIAAKTGREVTVVEAQRVALAILERGDNVAKPQAYVLGSITKSPAEIREQIDAERPAHTPSRQRECALHPHWPMPCEKCAAIAAEQEGQST